MTSDADAAAERSAELEMRIAFMDEQMQRLDDALASQHGRIDALSEQVETLRARLQARDEAEPDSAPEPPPPHY